MLVGNTIHDMHTLIHRGCLEPPIHLQAFRGWDETRRKAKWMYREHAKHHTDRNPSSLRSNQESCLRWDGNATYCITVPPAIALFSKNNSAGRCQKCSGLTKSQKLSIISSFTHYQRFPVSTCDMQELIIKLDLPSLGRWWTIFITFWLSSVFTVWQENKTHHLLVCAA